MLIKYFTCSLFATFCFAHANHFWTCFEGIYIIINNNYEQLIIFKEAYIYLNEPIKIDKKFKKSKKCYVLIYKKKHMKKEKNIAPMEFAEYFRKPGISENSKVYWNERHCYI